MYTADKRYLFNIRKRKVENNRKKKTKLCKYNQNKIDLIRRILDFKLINK